MLPETADAISQMMIMMTILTTEMNLSTQFMIAYIKAAE